MQSTTNKSPHFDIDKRVHAWLTNYINSDNIMELLVIK
jgi:hypothetical protein